MSPTERRPTSFPQIIRFFPIAADSTLPGASFNCFKAHWQFRNFELRLMGGTDGGWMARREEAMGAS